MSDVLSKIVDMVVLVLVGFIAPVIIFIFLTGQITTAVSKQYSADFSENVSTKGYITTDMYEDYIGKVTKTSGINGVELSVKRNYLAPEYAFYTIEEARELLEDKNISNVLNQSPLTSARPAVADTGVSRLQTENNSDVIRNANDTPSLNHIHTDECFYGHSHLVSGCTYHTHDESCMCGSTLSVIGQENGKNIYGCKECFMRLGFYPETTDTPGICREIVCGLTEGYTCGQEEDYRVRCDEIVVSAKATHEVQKMYLGEELITTMVLFYMDGHTKTVEGTYEGELHIGDAQTVTVSYECLSIDGNGAVSADITVDIYPSTKVCPNGHVINAGNDECPYCKVYPRDFTVGNPLPIKIKRGKSLIESGIFLKVTYMDGHYEEVLSGFTDNLDIEYVGKQTVTIGYNGLTLDFEMETVRNTKICPDCGYEYELNLDDSDPGCPKCLSAVPYFTGNTIEYEETVSMEEILDELYSGDGRVSLKKGDRLTIEAGTGTLPGFGILKFLYGKSAGKQTVVSYTVKIRNEE